MDFIRRAAICAVFLAVWAIYLAHLSPSVGVGDSGEFITGAVTLSLPHAPSYPLFLLLGKVLHQMVPFGNSAYRLNLMSAIFNLLSAALIFFIARRMNLSALAAVTTACLAAASPAFFHNGLVTEVFALNTFLALAFWGAALLPGRRGGMLAVFILGLGMGNHQTILLAAPGVAVLLWRAWKRGDFGPLDWKRILPALALAFAVGLTVYILLPLRSPKNPPLDWGHPRDLNGVYRTMLRKDYGTMALALGEQPPRTVDTGIRQLKRYFADGMGSQFSWLGVIFISLGLWVAWKRDRALALAIIAAWLFSGPFFALLGNLPSDAQSDGLLERFYILPTVFVVFGIGFLVDALWQRKKTAACLIFLLPILIMARSAETFPLREDFLAPDYARSIFRTLPPDAAFFMDGGDDTFFTTAFQQFVQRQRADIHLFDRGGLIFSSAYGPDFRSLNHDAKESRRQEAEHFWLSKGPLFYSTMNEKILNDVPLAQVGFLYRAGMNNPDDLLWQIYGIRSLYPPASSDFRTHALAPYFPFLRARSVWRKNDFDAALAFFDRAWAFGPGVPWLKNNFSAELLELAYGRLRASDWKTAEILSRKCLAVDPANMTALSNLGVIAEHSGDLNQAADWYERALRIDARNVEVLYNLSVVRWRQNAWDQVVPLLDEVLRLQPDHAQALRYLPLARQKLASHG